MGNHSMSFFKVGVDFDRKLRTECAILNQIVDPFLRCLMFGFQWPRDEVCLRETKSDRNIDIAACA